MADDHLLQQSLRDFVSENAKTAISNDQKDKVLSLSSQKVEVQAKEVKVYQEKRKGSGKKKQKSMRQQKIEK